jgi:hypothetical protein
VCLWFDRILKIGEHPAFRGDDKKKSFRRMENDKAGTIAVPALGSGSSLARDQSCGSSL